MLEPPQLLLAYETSEILYLPSALLKNEIYSSIIGIEPISDAYKETIITIILIEHIIGGVKRIRTHIYEVGARYSAS